MSVINELGKIVPDTVKLLREVEKTNKVIERNIVMELASHSLEVDPDGSVAIAQKELSLECNKIGSIDKDNFKPNVGHVDPKNNIQEAYNSSILDNDNDNLGIE